MKRKWFVLLIAMLLIVVPVFMGCAPEEPDPAAPEEPEEPEEPVEEPVEAITLELADTNAPDHVLVHAGDMFAELVEERTDGEIIIERYRHGELYGPRELIEAVEMGTAAIGIQHVAFVGGHSPALEFISAFGAQGIWDGTDHYHRFLDQPRVQEIADQEFEEKLNQRLLAILDYGTSVFASAEKPVRTIEDYEGQRARAAGTAQATMYETLGTDPVDLDIGEVYMALERGTIEAFCTGPARVYLDGFYEVAPYITQDFTAPRLSFWLTINNDTWADLTPEQQQIMEEAAVEVTEFAREKATEDIEYYQERLEEEAEEFVYLEDDERARIREAVEPVMYDLIMERAGEEMGQELWDLMEEAR